MPKARSIATRRGMTFLEVVVATAMFGVVAASIVGVFSFAVGTQVRQQRLLACAEVANRLIISYMDDSTSLPDPNKTVEFGPKDNALKFRWEYREDPLVLVESNSDKRDAASLGPLSNDRYKQVTVHVWLAEESGGSRAPTDTTPQVTLTRMFDPVYPRNPDSFMNMIRNPKGFQGLMDSMQGFNRERGNAAAPSRRSQGSSRHGGSIRPSEAFGHGGDRGRR